ncbi:MAG: flagellar motor switch protein FliG [Treponema sp.]|nr:flagellar motor switch protein FliG [Treponema sp.]
MNTNDHRLKAYFKATQSENKKEEKQIIQNEENKSFQKNVLNEVSNKLKKNNDVNPAKPISEYMDRYGMIKVTKSDEKKTFGGESVYRRVAKFLLLIGIDEAAKIIPHLTVEQTEKIIPEIASIRSVDTEEANVILAEFQNLVDQSRHTGGVDTARDILVKAFGTERANQMIEKTVAFPEGKPFEYLKDLDAERIAQLLIDESAPVRALVLSHLEPKVAASYIGSLPAEEKTEVIQRLAKLTKMSPDIIRRIDSAMHEKIYNINTQKANIIDGRNALANILKKMSSDNENAILSSLGKNDPELAYDIKNRLFTTEDFINCDDKWLQNKLQTMMDTQIAYIIAGKTDDFRGKILSNVSSGRGQLILDEEKLRKPMLKKDVDEATNLFMSSLRRSWEKGELIILNRDDEVYV